MLVGVGRCWSEVGGGRSVVGAGLVVGGWWLELVGGWSWLVVVGGGRRRSLSSEPAMRLRELHAGDRQAKVESCRECAD